MASHVAAPEAAARIERAGYPFQSRYLDLPEGRMHYLDEGRGETLLFAHGTPTWSYEWRHLIRGLSSAWRCVAPDHLGFGLSDRPREFAYSPEAHARNLAAFAKALDLKDITLVAHDFGGPIAFPLCFERPARVKRLVLFNTWMWSFADDKDMDRKARVAEGALGRFLYRRGNFSLRVLMPYAFGDRKKLTPEIHRQYLERFPDAWSREKVLWALARALRGSSDFYQSLWDRREHLRTLPTLILWGRRDRAFGPALLSRWRAALPDAQVVELPEAGHWPQEEQPEAMLAALRAFLAVAEVRFA